MLKHGVWHLCKQLGTAIPKSFPFAHSSSQMDLSCWSFLPNDIVRLIVSKYLSEVDRLYFRSVCQQSLRIWTPEFVKRGEKFGHVLYSNAVLEGHVNRLDWLKANGSIPPKSSKSSIQYLGKVAAESGHLSALQWFENVSAGRINSTH